MDTQIVRGSLPQMQGVIRSKQRRSVFHLIAGAFAMTDILRRSWAMISDGAKPIDWLILIVDCLGADGNFGLRGSRGVPLPQRAQAPIKCRAYCWQSLWVHGQGAKDTTGGAETETIV